MKKLILFFLFISSVIYGQPPIAQPNNMVQCDYDGDGFTYFYLISNNNQILNGLSSTQYTITFYESMVEAETNSNQISNPLYTNLTSVQTIYVRVQENANPTNFATTSFELIVNLAPSFELNDLTLCTGQTGMLQTGLSNSQYTFEWFRNEVVIPNEFSNFLLVSESGSYKVIVTDVVNGCTIQKVKGVIVSTFMNVPEPVDFVIYENPNDNVAQFDLYSHNYSLIGGTSEYTMTYHTSIDDANTGLNAISNIDNYTNISNPQTLYIRVEKNFIGCYIIREFDLIIQLGNDIVNIPDSAFKNKLLSANSTNQIAKDLEGNWTTVDINNDGNIQFSEAQNVSYLDMQFVNINSLEGINSFINLINIDCSNNSIDLLNFINLLNLQTIKCFNNQILEIQLPNNNSLLSLEIGGNPIASLNLMNNNNIFRLHIASTQISSLDIGSLDNLSAITYNQNITNLLNFNNPSNITSLQIYGITTTNYDFSVFPNLINLSCNSNILTILDLSQNPLLNTLYVSYTTSIEILNLKNGGSNLSAYQIVGNHFNYVCVNDNVSPLFINSLQNSNSINVNINSYCSVAPGGDYNTITGSTKFDLNSNGCDALDISIPFMKFNIGLNGFSTNFVHFSNQGIYNFYTAQTGDFTLTPDLENPAYFNVSPNPATVTIAEIDNTTTIQNFCITPNGIHPDLEVVLVPIIPARPGFDAVYKIVYKNKGNQTVNGIVFFDFNYAYMDFVSAVPAQNSSSAGYYGFNFTDLAPFETRSILVTLNINAPTETNAVNIGDVLEFDTNVILTSGSTSETETDDNIFYLNQTVVGSYDPNDITCLQGNALPTTEIGEYLHYNIRFENTGTAPAENIVVKNTIDISQYDIQSLQIMESSNPVTVKVNGNIAEFIFQSIDLDTGGHGNILLKLKSNSTLPNDLVINGADIFFDYNFPIVTNEEQTVFADLSKNDFVKDASIQVYPNPTTDIINIKADNMIKSIQLYDVQGRLLITKMTNENAQIIDLSSYSSGIYFVNISTTTGKQTQKIIKN